MLRKHWYNAMGMPGPILAPDVAMLGRSMGEPGISIGKTGIGLAIAAAPIPPPDATGGLSAYVLSSAHATDRWARMEKRLVDAHANYTKFAGIDGRQRIPELTKVGVTSHHCWLCDAAVEAVMQGFGVEGWHDAVAVLFTLMPS